MTRTRKPRNKQAKRKSSARTRHSAETPPSKDDTRLGPAGVTVMQIPELNSMIREEFLIAKAIDLLEHEDFVPVDVMFLPVNEPVFTISEQSSRTPEDKLPHRKKMVSAVKHLRKHTHMDHHTAVTTCWSRMFKFNKFEVDLLAYDPQFIRFWLSQHKDSELLRARREAERIRLTVKGLGRVFRDAETWANGIAYVCDFVNLHRVEFDLRTKSLHDSTDDQTSDKGRQIEIVRCGASLLDVLKKAGIAVQDDPPCPRCSASPGHGCWTVHYCDESDQVKEQAIAQLMQGAASYISRRNLEGR